MQDSNFSSADIQKRLIAKQKREAKRYERMLSGLEDLETWMADLLRQGLASVEGQPYSFWAGMASRMVDSQVKGADKLIKQMALLPGSGHDWPDKILTKFAELHLLIRSFRRLPELPEPIATDVKTFAGISLKREEIKAAPGIEDRWLVIGSVESIEEDLRVRRTWLAGESSHRFVLILDYAHGSRDFMEFYDFGACLEGEIVFYPGNFPLRGIFKAPFEAGVVFSLPESNPTFGLFLTEYSDAITRSPWIQRFPMGVQYVMPILEKDKLILVDKENKVMPCLNPGLTGWKILAFSGGSPISVFGEWDGKVLLPISAWHKNNLINLKT